MPIAVTVRGFQPRLVMTMMMMDYGLGYMKHIDSEDIEWSTCRGHVAARGC